MSVTIEGCPYTIGRSWCSRGPAILRTPHAYIGTKNPRSSHAAGGLWRIIREKQTPPPEFCVCLVTCATRFLQHPAVGETTMHFRWAASRHLGVLRVPEPVSEREAAGHPPTRVRPLVDGPSCVRTKSTGCYSGSAQATCRPPRASQPSYDTNTRAPCLGKSARICRYFVRLSPRLLEDYPHAVTGAEVVASDNLPAGIAALAGADGGKEQRQRLGGNQCLLRRHTRPASRNVHDVKADNAVAIIGQGVAENRLNRNANHRSPELPPVRPVRFRLAHGLIPRSKAGPARGANKAALPHPGPVDGGPRCSKRSYVSLLLRRERHPLAYARG